MSVRDALRGAHVVLTGVTGFVGKVWLSHVLYEAPEIGRVTLIVRDGAVPARERVEDFLDTSPAFRPLRARHGAAWAAFLSDRVDVIAGDCALPMCGLDEATVADLARTADVVLHCAGLTDFQPDPGEAVAANVHGSRHAADLAARLSVPRLVHVSTCYVAGSRQGVIGEDLEPGVSPNGTPFDVAAEIAAMHAAAGSGPTRGSAPTIDAPPDGGPVPTPAVHAPAEVDADPVPAEATASDVGADPRVGPVPAKTTASKKERIAAAMVRASALGWPNLYTFSKALAEHALAAREDVAATIARPAIVECALRYPFPGWNEGLNTAGPLSWLLASPFRSLPSNPSHRFDVVPVDLVAKALTLAIASSLRDEPPAVWQIASSHRNPFTFGRAIELNGLALRKHTRHRATAAETLLRHLDPLPKPASDGVGSVPWLARLTRKAHTALGDAAPESLPRWLHGPARAAHDAAWFGLGEASKTLARIDRMLDLYRPFVHDHDWTFRADRAAAASAALPDDERAFAFDVEAIDWRTYWIDVEVPGLRTWTFPLLDGLEAPRDAPSESPVRLLRSPALKEGVA